MKNAFDDNAVFRRFIPVERHGIRLEERADGDESTDPKDIHGTASVFFDPKNADATQYRLWTGAVERVASSAFDGIADDDVRCLKNHDPNLLLGRNVSGTLALNVDAAGLQYLADTPDTVTGRDCVQEIERGDMTGSSFTFQRRDEDGIEWSEEEHDDGAILYIRTLVNVRTYDVAPVTFPAYHGASSGVRSSRSPAITPRSDSFEAEVRALKAELDHFIRSNNYASEAAARLAQLEGTLTECAIL